MSTTFIHLGPCLTTITQAMHPDKNELLRCAFLSIEEGILVKNILLTHDPDGRQIDSQMLLRSMEDVMFYATMSNVSKSHLAATAVDNMNNNQIVDLYEALGQTIYIISQEILRSGSGDQDLHAKTMMILDLLRNFTWDAKMVIALAAFATSYGEFWLIIQLYPLNSLALSVAMLKQLPNNLSAFRPRFKALSVLFKRMVDVTKCIIHFEGIRLQNVKMGDMTMFTTNSDIYLAVYWVIRSTLTCSSIITDLIAKNHEQVNSTSITIATWELSSLVCKMSSICGYLQKEVDIRHTQIEDKVHQKLLNLLKESNMDNQEMLSTLFALKDDMPLKDISSQQLGVSELLNKVVILLISKPNIHPLEDLLFLAQQTYNVPHRAELERSYEILWVPISSSGTWSNTEAEVFDYLSNTLPWYSIRQPWLLNTAVVKFIKQQWNFVDEPLMVVLDPHGTVSSLNAISMVCIWGAMAYPFSNLREQQLWEDTIWNLKLIMGEIDPLMSMRVEEQRIICLYGSEDLEWIREFTRKIKKIVSTGIQLEVVYVGKRNPGKGISYTLAAIAEEKLSGSLSLHDMHFYWLRLESIQRSKLQIGMTTDTDHILKEVVSMVSHGDSGWALFGEGSSPDTVQYHGSELMERINLFPQWAQNIRKVGFVCAMRSALEPPPSYEPCCRCNVVPYVEGLAKVTVVCEECKGLMETFVLYKCQGTQ